MGIVVKWDNVEQTVIRMEFDGGWDFGGFRKAIEPFSTRNSRISRIKRAFLKIFRARSVCVHKESFRKFLLLFHFALIQAGI